MVNDITRCTSKIVLESLGTGFSFFIYTREILKSVKIVRDSDDLLRIIAQISHCLIKHLHELSIRLNPSDFKDLSFSLCHGWNDRGFRVPRTRCRIIDVQIQATSQCR